MWEACVRDWTKLLTQLLKSAAWLFLSGASENHPWETLRLQKIHWWCSALGLVANLPNYQRTVCSSNSSLQDVGQALVQLEGYWPHLYRQIHLVGICHSQAPGKMAHTDLQPQAASQLLRPPAKFQSLSGHIISTSLQHRSQDCSLHLLLQVLHYR